MALDFPSNPVNGQVYDNFIYDSIKGTWKSLSAGASPTVLVSPTISNAVITATATNATTVPLTVNGAVSQSANLQEWKDSAGTTLVNISSDGSLFSSKQFYTSGKVVGTTQPNAGSDGGVAVRAPASGTQTSGFLQFVNNAYNAQWASIEATPSSELKLNASYVKKPYQPAFGVHSTQATTQGNDIVWEQVTFNVGSHYNTSNGRFTAPVSGYYYFHAHGLWNYSVTGDLRVSLYKNGSGFPGMRTIETKAVGQWITWHIQGIVSMAAGDYATVRVDQLTNGMHTDAGYNQFSGYLMG